MSIVNDGLVLYFDAIDNAVNGVHDGSTTVWVDLSGNGNNGTLNGGTWGENFLHFDGRSWVNCGERNPSKITLEVLVKYDEIGGSSVESNSTVGNWESGGYGIQQKNGLHSANINIDGTWYHLYGSAPKTENIVHLALTYDNSTIKLYENGRKVAETSISGNIKSPSRATVLSIGSNPNGTAFGINGLKGNVYSVRLYDRALSADEVFGNYKYDYGRFVLSIIYKYLIRDGSTIYTVQNNSLVEVVGDLNAQLFIDNGVDEIPSGTLLMTLSNPEVLCWTNAEKLPTLTATVKGIPEPQIVMSKEIDLMDGSIKGINGVTVDCKGDVLFAVSFDKKATWMMHNGTEWVAVSDKLAGMTKTEFEAITAEQWQPKYEASSDMYIRCILFDETQSITTVNIDFIN